MFCTTLIMTMNIYSPVNKMWKDNSIVENHQKRNSKQACGKNNPQKKTCPQLYPQAVDRIECLNSYPRVKTI